MGDEIEKLHQQIDKLTVGDKKEWGLLDDDDGPIPPPNFDDDAKTKKGDSAGASKGDGAGAAASATSGGGSGGGAASSTTTGGGGDKSASSDKLSKDEYGAVGTELERTHEDGIDIEVLEAEVLVQQADPTSPLYSVNSFEDIGLRPELLRAITDMNYKKPSSIQEKALPLILKDPYVMFGVQCPEHIIGQAQSGTGKTAAFSLGMLSRVDPAKRYPQAVCVCPTRELAKQISDVIRSLAKYCNISVRTIVAQDKLPSRIEDQILVGTPGKIKSACVPRKLRGGGMGSPPVNMKKVLMFVLDEADSMLGQHRQECLDLKRQCAQSTQFLCFSATFEEDIKEFMEEFVPHPRNQIMVKKKDVAIERIHQFYVRCADGDARYTVLKTLYEYITVGQCMIFVDMKRKADDLCARMRRDLLTVELLHGNLQVAQRDEIMEKFRQNQIRILITTDVLARGIDVPQVSLVVNYDMPHDHKDPRKADVKTYIHRIGRTGRYGKPGVAINFVHDDNSMGILKYIHDDIQREITEITEQNLSIVSDELNKLFKKTKNKRVMVAPDD